MKRLLTTTLFLCIILVISACAPEGPLAKTQAIKFLETQGYTEISILGEVDYASECPDSFYKKGYAFKGAFQWVDKRTRYAEGVVCGGEYEGEIIWSSAAGEMATDLNGGDENTFLK